MLINTIRKIKHSVPMIVFVVLIGVVGTISLFISHGSTPNISTETEDGTITCATKLSDTSASGGQDIKFNACNTGLDNTGKTIPDSNYAVPTSNVIFMATNGSDSATGSRTQPVKTLNRAIALVPSGGTIVVRGGTDNNPSVYRDWYHTTNTNLNIEVEASTSKKFSLQAFPHEKAWFDGTDVKAASSWTSDGNGHYYMAWNTPSFCDTGPSDTSSAYYSQSLTKETTGPCAHADMSRDPSNPLAKDPQMVFIDGTYAHEETSLAAVKSTSFYYDWSAKKIYIGINPSGHTVELAARPAMMMLGGNGSKVLGLGFRRYATDEYDNNARGAIASTGANQLFENNTFTQMAGGGVGLSSSDTNSTFNHNVYAFNGYDGMRGSAGDGFLLTNNVVNNNNTELFGTDCGGSCAQAGVKIAHTDGFTVKNNYFTNNYGQGFWCDLDCNNGVIVDNLAQNNFFSGLMYEVSNNGILASNLVINNGVTGIRISSANTRLYNNTLVNNGRDGGDKGGHGNIWIYDDPRTPTAGQIGPNTTAVSVVNNVIYSTAKDSSTGDMIRSFDQQTSPSDAGYFSALNHNSYYRTGGTSQPLFIWAGGTVYKSISALKSAYPLVPINDDDDTGAASDPFFVSYSKQNYAIRSSSDAYHTGTTIPTDIATKVGGSAAANQSRGVIIWPNVQ